MNDLGPASQLGLPLPTNANATNNANLSVISGGGYITTNNITSNYINRGAPNPEVWLSLTLSAIVIGVDEYAHRTQSKPRSLPVRAADLI